MIEHPILRLPWPDKVCIVSQDDISNQPVCGPEDEPQTLWGHLNNIFRKDHSLSMHQICLLFQGYNGVFAIACHIMKVDIDYLKRRRDSALAFNAAWCALGYTEGQSKDAIALGEKVWALYTRKARPISNGPKKERSPFPTKRTPRKNGEGGQHCRTERLSKGPRRRGR